jgi:hypothetical protein
MNYSFKLTQRILIPLLVLLMGGIFHPQSALAQTNQVQSQDVVEWEPLARIDQNKPVRIEIKNTTPEPLEYVVTTQTNFRTLAPGDKVQLNSLPLPTFLNINATRSVGVKYLISVDKNVVKVELKLTSGQGDTTLNIDDKGAIYLY